MACLARIPMMARFSASAETPADRALVFGASGALGGVICATLAASGVAVLRAGRGRTQEGDVNTSETDWRRSLPAQSLNRVIWAQGLNSADDLTNVTSADLRPVIEANVMFIVDSLHELLDSRSLADDAAMVVVSSVWQDLARQGKISYVTSKAAVGGLVRSLAGELGDRGQRINAVLPGVVDSPMTRKFLPPETIRKVEEETPGRRLVQADWVANVCLWLTDRGSRGVNGQSIVVDGGWSVFRRL